MVMPFPWRKEQRYITRSPLRTSLALWRAEIEQMDGRHRSPGLEERTKGLQPGHIRLWCLVVEHRLARQRHRSSCSTWLAIVRLVIFWKGCIVLFLKGAVCDIQLLRLQEKLNFAVYGLTEISDTENEQVFLLLWLVLQMEATGQRAARGNGAVRWQISLRGGSRRAGYTL